MDKRDFVFLFQPLDRSSPFPSKFRLSIIYGHPDENPMLARIEKDWPWLFFLKVLLAIPVAVFFVTMDGCDL